MKNKPKPIKFTHKEKTYLLVYEGGLFPLWGIYQGEEIKEKYFVDAYKAWGETNSSENAIRRFRNEH